MSVHYLKACEWSDVLLYSFLPSFQDRSEWTIWSREESLLLAKKGSTNSCVVQFEAESLHRVRQPDSRLLFKTDHMLYQHVQKSNSAHNFTVIPCVETFKSEVKLLFLSNASQFPKEHWFLEGSQASPVFPSANSIM